ncbi:MAG: hypothetical protein AAGA56_28245, partial [Myxococcota bacterium]
AFKHQRANKGSSAPASNSEFYYNSVIGPTDVALRLTDSGPVDIRCNLFTRARLLKTSTLGSFEVDETAFAHNVFTGTALDEFGSNRRFPDDSTFASEELCLPIQRLTESAEVCVPGAVPNADGPLATGCPGDLGARPGLGVDDQTHGWPDLFFLPPGQDPSPHVGAIPPLD